MPKEKRGFLFVSKRLTGYIYRFYYGDQRKADGAAVYNAIDGDAHAKLYLELAEGETQGPWQQTFVPGTGYKDFSAA